MTRSAIDLTEPFGDVRNHERAVAVPAVELQYEGR